VKVGDIVKLTVEGRTYLYDYFKAVNPYSVGLIVKKYLYQDGEDHSNDQDVYDILIAGKVVQSIFDSEIVLAND
jgi:hypothetical protein